MNEALQLPSELVHHVTGILGDLGAAWLEKLPDVVQKLENDWLVNVQQPFEAGEFNFVAPATRGGEAVVLKIAPPYNDGEYIGEANFLRTRNGDGAVRLLEQDLDRRAILIERAKPGHNLAELFTGREADALAPAIEVFRSILGQPPDDRSGIKTVDEWFDGMRRAEGTEFPAEYVTKAFDIYETLSKQRGRTFYLHGDFHPANIVNAQRAPYLAIDPKGVIGHMGYDIGVFLNNLHWWQETKPDVGVRLGHAIEQFSVAFDIPPIELRHWAFAQMVLGAWWSFDDMPEYYDNAVAKADIWNV